MAAILSYCIIGPWNVLTFPKYIKDWAINDTLQCMAKEI